MGGKSEKQAIDPGRLCSGGVIVHCCLVYLAVSLCTSEISLLPVLPPNPTSKSLERHMALDLLPPSH